MPLAPALVFWCLAALGAGALARSGRVWPAAAALFLTFFLAGLTWRTLSARRAPDDLSRLATGRSTPASLGARVRDVPLPPHPDDPDPRPGPVVVEITRVRAGGEWRPASGRALLYSREFLGPPRIPGGLWPLDEVEIVAGVRVPQGARAPGAFDRRAALAREGIGLEIGASSAQVTLVRRGSPLSLRRACARLRAHLAGTLRRTLSPRHSELFCALLLGHRPGIDPAVRARFARSGLGHLLAVSGLHLAILAGLLGGILRLARVGRRPAAVALALFAVFYAMLAGGRPPVVRAATMVVTYLAATVFGRERDLPNTVAFAAFALLTWQPGWLFDAGFQLSFAAVGFLAFLYPVLEDAWGALRGTPERFMDPLPENAFERVAHRARQALFISAAAWLGVQPLLLHYLGFMNPWAVVSNVIVIPLATVALAGGVLLLAAGCIFAPLGALFAYPASIGLGALLAAVDVFAMPPWSAVYLPSPGRAWLVAYYALALALFLYAPSVARALRDRGVPDDASRSRARRLLIAVGAGGALLLVSAAWLVFARGGGPPSPSVTVLHLGKARAAVVRTAGGADVLVNAGSPGSEAVLARRLRELGVRRIACAVITRDDERHTSGLVGVIENMPVGCLALPPQGAARRLARPPSGFVERGTRLARERGAAVLWPAPPDELTSGAGEGVRWLPPGLDPAYSPPPAVRVEGGAGFGVVFFEPGRGGAAYPRGASERADAEALAAEVLVFLPPVRQARGHGLADWQVERDTSAVARHVRPRAALVPLAGAESAFSGPAAALRALEAEVPAVVRTDREGTVRAYPEDGRLVVERWRDGEWRRVFSR